MLPWTAAFAAPAPSPAATPNVVGRDGLPPDLSAPTGLLDDGAGVTGIGQMAIDVGGGSVDLCTGTLINPRTVIFAAHCVNARPAADYGSARGGVALSFGFGTDNLTAVVEWLGNGGAPEAHRTNAAQALFNVEQVWYDPRSLALGPQERFLQADIALATLDTAAAGIPTWALLFSPLTAPQQALLVGYGGRGTGASGDIGIDFRRRAAENMVSLLGSLDDVDRALIGFSPGVHPQSLYQLDFDDPAFGTPQASAFDFNLFGGQALAREGITASGDSGSPLIIDKGYGTSTFYQPLFLFWDVIVANNPYRYATNRPGVGDWTDPAHWVQQMDPNYTVLQNGQLRTGLPGTRAQGVSGDTVKFGQVCSFDHCEQLSGNPGASQSAQPIPGGPGSTGFVPDNMAGTRAAQARYYDVTLSAPGLTRLAADIEIDRLTLDGATILDVRKGGSLTVVGDFFQRLGWTNIDGAVRTGEALFVDGVLSGSGLFDPGRHRARRPLVDRHADDRGGRDLLLGHVIVRRSQPQGCRQARRRGGSGQCRLDLAWRHGDLRARPGAQAAPRTGLHLHHRRGRRQRHVRQEQFAAPRRAQGRTGLSARRRDRDAQGRQPARSCEIAGWGDAGSAALRIGAGWAPGQILRQALQSLRQHRPYGRRRAGQGAPQARTQGQAGAGAA
jgi:hypothetical protein